MANTTTDTTPIFQAGNRKLDRTNLENTLVSGIEPYIETYQGTWGKENTAAVRQAYSQLINAIHDGKVSMNIDGSLHISDGSIANTPDKRGFDPVAKAAYFVTDIINRMPEYKEPKKETKKYGTDQFAKNFINYLAPPNSGVDINSLWANLDDEVQDANGNRSRPYTNRLAYFNKFLDQEIANLDNYDEVDEYWGNKEQFKNQLLDLKTRLNDKDISKEDSMMLAKLGFNPTSFFDTTGTPLTEEEKTALDQKKAEAETKLKEEQAKKAAQIQANRGVLGKEFAVYGRDAANNTAAYEKYLAKTYGTGEQGFNKINNQIQALLEKASDDNSNLSDSEKRQLGNFITYIQQNNPAFMNQQLDPAERAELKTHRNFINQDVIRLPWTTKNGRYVYADKSGNVYFLKPNNQVKFDYKYGVTDNEYKKNFLKHVPTPENEEYNRQLAGQRIVSDDLKTEDIIRFGAIAEDIGAFVSSFAPGYGTAASGVLSIGSLITDAIADKIDPSVSTEEWWKNLGINLGAGVLGLIPGGKSAGLVRKALKYAPMVYGAYQSGKIALNEEVQNSFKKLMSSGAENKLTVNDWKNIGAGFTALATFGMIGNRAYKQHNYNKLRGTSETTYDIKTKTTTNGETKNTTHNITKEQRAQINEAGKKGGQKAANEKLQEITKNKNVELAEGKFAAEAPSGRISKAYQRVAKVKQVKGTPKVTTTGTAHPMAQTVAEKNQKLIEKHPTLSKWMSTNYDIFVNGKTPVHIPVKRPEWAKPWWERNNNSEAASTTSKPTNNVSNAEIKLLQNSPVPNRIQKINEFVQTDNPEKIRAARQLFENSKTQMHPDQINAIGKKIADAEVRIQRQANAEQNIRQAQENNKKSENLLKSGGIDANVSRARAYISGQPKLTALLDKLMGKTTWKQMSASPEFKKLTRNQKLVLERAYNMLFEKEGGKLYKHQLGGKVQMFQGGGGVSHNKDTKWKNLVFDTYLQGLLDNLNLGGHKYAKWVNSMQTRHSGLYNQANKQDFLTTPWKHETVGSYQTDYRENSLAPLPWETEDGRKIGYNTGIRNAAKNNRYNVASPRPTSGDADAQNYISDNLYSGETDDRRILGREGDFTPEELNTLNEQLKANGNFFAYLDKDKYYKLGFFDNNGNKRVFTENGDAAYVPANINQPGQGISISGPLNNPTITTPDKIDILSTIRNKDIYGEGTDLNKNKLDVDALIQKGIIGGLSTADMLGAIATTNSNYKLAVDALRRFRPYDYTQQYHQVMDDYAGNQVANNQAADIERETGRPKTSNAALNAAVALEGILKAGNIRQQQAVRDQDIRQKHTDLAEQYGNANRAARVEAANKNNAALYEIEQRIADAGQDKNLANWTSISNFLKKGIYDAETAYNERKQIRDAWAANQLGSRQEYIRQYLNMDTEYQKLREDFKKNPKDDAIAERLRNKTAELIYKYGTDWDRLYANQYGLQYNGPRFSRYEMFRRYGIPVQAKGGKLTQEEIYLREDNRNRRANADRFMKTIWKAIDVYLKQKNSK